MLNPIYTNQFHKDIKRAKKRNKNFEKFKAIAKSLVMEEPLNPKHRDHALTGNYRDRRECHIEPDWLLIYKIENNNLIFERMGTHADLFK